MKLLNVRIDKFKWFTVFILTGGTQVKFILYRKIIVNEEISETYG